MSYETDAAERYRRHADELRKIARSDFYLDTRDALYCVANDYEKIAGKLEDAHKTNLIVLRFAELV